MQEKSIDQNKIEQYISVFAALSERAKVVINIFKKEWDDDNECPPFISLLGDIGIAIVNDLALFDTETCTKIFSHIELGMKSDDDYLSTAVATGLIEALVNISDNNPCLWGRIESLLEKESKEYALAWKYFEPVF